MKLQATIQPKDNITRWQWRLAAITLLLSSQASMGKEAMHLMQAYEAARANDPIFQGAQAMRREGLEYRAIGNSKVLPSISAVVSSNRNQSQVTDSSGRAENRGRYASSTSSLQLRQPLYDREAWAAKNQGIARTASSEALFRAREQELIVRVFEAYSKALLASEDVLLVQAQLRSADEQLRANQHRLVQGEGTRTDVLETSSKQALIQAELIVAQDHAQNALDALQAIVGEPVDGLERLTVEGAAALLPGTLDDWRATALSVNPEIESLKQTVEAARQEIRRVDSGHYPRLALLLSAGNSESDTTSTYRQSSRTSTVGVQLNVPIFSGGAVSAQSRQAVAQLIKAQADLDTRLAELQVELHRQYSLQKSSVLRIEALESAVTASYALIEATRRSFAGGERTNVDVLDAQERLAKSVRNLMQARYEQLLAGLRLRHLAGVLGEPDLRAVAAKFGKKAD